MKIAIASVIVLCVIGVLLAGLSQSKAKNRMEALALREQVEYAEKQAGDIVRIINEVPDVRGKIDRVISEASNMVPEIVGAESAGQVYGGGKQAEKRKAAPRSSDVSAVKSVSKVDAEMKVGLVRDAQGREAPAGVGVVLLNSSALNRKPVSSSDGDSGGDKDNNGGRADLCRKGLEKLEELRIVIEGMLGEAVAVEGESAKVLKDVTSSISSVTAKKHNIRFQEMLPVAESIPAGCNEAVAEAGVILDQFREMAAEVREEKRLAAEEAARIKALEEENARHRSEMDQASAWYEGKADHLKRYDFQGVSDAVLRLQESLTFDDAKTILNIPAERYALMAGVMDFLRKTMKDRPFSWGWRTSSGALDITAADKDGLTVQDTLIRWEDIGADRYIFFFSHYLPLADITGKNKAKLFMGAALFCKTYGYDSSVESFLNKAEIESPEVARQSAALLAFEPDPQLSAVTPVKKE